MFRRILVAEDSPTMRALISSTLQGLGDYEIVEVPNGFEALRVLPKEKIDMVITDINMPEINGLELVSFIRTNPNYKELPVLIVSTEGSERDRQKGLQLGANDYLVKPFDPQHLQNLVRKYLSQEPSH